MDQKTTESGPVKARKQHNFSYENARRRVPPRMLGSPYAGILAHEWLLVEG
jgi:hypothetical protein